MLTQFKTVKCNIEAEIVVKKSQFIANVYCINDEAEFKEKLSFTKKKYNDARHHVFAYRLSNGLERYSDDGEPAGTAGVPILDILSSAVALVLIYFQFGKYKVRLIMPSLKRSWVYLKESFEYFLSTVAGTAFGALNTLLIGMFLSEQDIAVWSVALQLIMVVQMCYGPIIDGV